MGKNTFIPPMPHIEPPSQETIDQLQRMTKEDRERFKKSPEYRKYVQPVIDRRKARQREYRKQWMWEKGLPIANLILALVAAITGVLALLR